MASQALTVRKVLAAAVVAGSLFPVLPSEATLLPPNSRSQLLSEPEATPSRAIPYVITPERRALLNTIRFAEGTWKGGFDVGYRVMFGGGLMPSMDRHPNRVIYRSRYASAAAGAYQFMPFTWNLVQRSIGVRGLARKPRTRALFFWCSDARLSG